MTAEKPFFAIGDRERGMLLLVGGLVFAHYFISHHMEPFPGEISSLKPFDNFDDFYPFYISQHADATCRRLHVIGTSIVVLFAMIEPRVFASLLVSLYIGLSLIPITRTHSHGSIEGFSMLFTYLTTMFVSTKSWKKALVVPVVAYSFAWAGHFLFEHNRPATFIYPTYSLIGDMKLWAETATFAREF